MTSRRGDSSVTSRSEERQTGDCCVHRQMPDTVQNQTKTQREQAHGTSKRAQMLRSKVVMVQQQLGRRIWPSVGLLLGGGWRFRTRRGQERRTLCKWHHETGGSSRGAAAQVQGRGGWGSHGSCHSLWRSTIGSMSLGAWRYRSGLSRSLDGPKVARR